MTGPGPTPHRYGLFRRIYLTFVLTVAAFAAIVGAAVYLYSTAFGQDWVAETLEQLPAESDAVAEVLHDPAALERKIADLSDTLRARVSVHDRDGHLIAGRGPKRIPRRAKRRMRQLRRGRPVVRRRGKVAAPQIFIGLTDAVSGQLLGVLAVEALPRGPFRSPWGLATLAGLLFVVLAAGSYPLARSLTRRLARLEASAGRIASGEFHHRVDIESRRASDELDQLAVAFNDMATQVETLLKGQRTLLANVSHELRTPIARMKVLVEILEDRLETLPPNDSEASAPTLSRLRRGITEMGSDIAEVEVLISDLLTSGRLELGPGGQTIQREHIDVTALLARIGPKFDAEASSNPAALAITGDALLLERLLSNLLSNARRACPSGEVSIHAAALPGDRIQIAVEDEGPGIPPNAREAVFEPFSRLDGARSRDQGGAGLGLHLCRQIARAHQGSISVEDRQDGCSGARMVVVLPAWTERA